MNELLKKLAELKSVELNDEVIQASEKGMADLKQKANEIMHTTNTGYGLELIPVNTLTDTVLDMVPQYATILNAFMIWFHGNQMWKSELVPIIGEIPFAQANAEATTWAMAITQGKYRLPTDKVTINQYNLICSVDVTNAELAYSIVDLQQKVLEKIAKSMTRTIESAIMNGDPNTSTGWNVNSYDQAAATTFAATWGANDHRNAGRTGLRATALAGTVTKDYVDVWTLEVADLFSTRWNLGLYSVALNELALIFDYKAHAKLLSLPEFTNRYQNGKNSTVITGAVTNVAGVDMFVHRDFPATSAGSIGMASATAWNNTKW